jgi:hypothetical protein
MKTPLHEKKYQASSSEELNPKEQAAQILGVLSGVYVSMGFGDHKSFKDKIFIPAWLDVDNATEEIMSTLFSAAEMTGVEGKKFAAGEKEIFIRALTIQLTAAFIVKALKATEMSGEAWMGVCLASRLLGNLEGMMGIKLNDTPGLERTRQGQKGAKVRHAPNLDAKLHVWRWCDENMSKYETFDDATTAVVVGKLVHSKWSTIRGYIREWNKQRTRLWEWCVENIHNYENADDAATAIKADGLVEFEWTSVRNHIRARYPRM